MRIFVASTGRSGTCTFYQACKHATNYTVGHETAAGGLGEPSYPDNHIEVSGALVHEMGWLIEKYPDAKWVHFVRRDRNACSLSLATQCRKDMERWTRRWRQVAITEEDLLCAATCYYDSVNAQIRRLLPPGSMTMHLEDMATLNGIKYWLGFWNWIRAEGEFAESWIEWTRKYNSSARRGREHWIPTIAKPDGTLTS